MAKEKEQEKAEKKTGKEQEQSIVENIENEIIREESKVMKELKKNPWIAATFVFAIIALVLLFVAFRGGGVSESSIGEKAVSFINTQLLQGRGNVELKSVIAKGGLYEVTVLYNNQSIPTYFTKDGEYYVGTQMFPTTIDTTTTPDTTNTPKEVPKSDKPVVELFVMTHCPYGVQAEKGVLPALSALGNKIDGKIRFVHYFMHGDKEEQETYRQLCIRETVPTSFNNYLSCFLEDGNSTRCLKKYNLNMDSCIANKAKEYYTADSALSNSYGVQGSPTLVINGVQVDFYPRDPANALKTMCSAFNTPPAECDSVLSTASPDPGFGTTSTTASAGTATSGAACASA